MEAMFNFIPAPDRTGTNAHRLCRAGRRCHPAGLQAVRQGAGR